MKISKLTSLVFALFASVLVVNSATVTADADGEGMTVVIVDANGNLLPSAKVAPGQSYSPPAGVYLASVSGAGSISLGGDATVNLSSTSAVMLSTDITDSGSLGVMVSSGTATVSSPSGSQTLAAGTGSTFTSVNTASGAISSPAPFPAPGFVAGVTTQAGVTVGDVPGAGIDADVPVPDAPVFDAPGAGVPGAGGGGIGTGLGLGGGASPEVLPSLGQG